MSLDLKSEQYTNSHLKLAKTSLFAKDEGVFQLDEDAFRHRFRTEEDCEQFIFKAKWPEGFSCPRCNHVQAYFIRSRRLPLYECRKCRHQTSLIAGTIMEGSRTSLRKWFLAYYYMSRTDQGTNAVQLSSLIQVTYKTAWSILLKIRQAMSHADNKQPLSGTVVGGTTFYRPLNTASSAINHYPEQNPVFVAASLDPNSDMQQLKIKTIRAQHLGQRSVLHSATKHFIKMNVNRNTGDVNIQTKRFHFPRIPSLKKCINQAKAWINRTYYGIGPKYLQQYLDEFCFRLNLQIRNAPIFEHLAVACIRHSFNSCKTFSDTI